MAKRGRPAGQPKTLWDKVKDIDEDFAVGINGMSDDQLREKLVNFANESMMYEDKKAADKDLKRLTTEKKTASDTYDEPMKAIKLKRRLAIQTLRERGKLSDLEQ